MNSRFKIGYQWFVPCRFAILAVLIVAAGRFVLPILTPDARQVQASSLAPTLLHYWLFDSTIPNDTPLEILGASYSALSDADVYIEFESALAGYPFDEEHPDWRKASMERRNAPTEINYRPEGNEGIPFEEADMRGIQIKQPFTNADYNDTMLFDRQNTLIFHLPTTGYQDVVFQFAAKDEGAADALCFDYATSANEDDWITTDAISDTASLDENFQLYTLDFTGIEAINNNPAFKIRIRFAGSDMIADEGNQVTFNNISLDGRLSSAEPPSLYRVYLPLALRNYPWIVLNEYMASNSVTIDDEDGDSSDWIELYNNSTTAVNLTGFGLSDDPGDPFRWTFPAVELGPQSHLLVWASGKNRAQPGQPLHTNFSISADGEPLLLTHPGGWTIDRVGPVALPRDISYGRQPNGAGAWIFFDQPTPGHSNNTLGYKALLDPPTFSHTGGFFSAAFDLTLSHNDPGVSIIFTLDGSVPDPQNLTGRTYTYKNQYAENPGDPYGQLLLGTYQTHLYTQPLAIVDRTTALDRLTGKSSTYERNPTYFPQTPVFKGTVVRAQAIRNGAMPSPVQTHTFFVTPEARERYTLPVVALSMQEDTLFGYDEGIYTAGADFDAWRTKSPGEASGWYVPANWRRETEFEGYLELLEPNDSAVVFNQAMGFSIHGGASRILRFKSLRLYARDDYGASDFAYPFFPGQPYTSYRRLILRNSGNDLGATMFRDAMIHTSVAHLNFDTQAYRPVIVFLNGEYWGIHNLRERYDEHYLARVYGVDPDNVDLLTGNSNVVEGDAVSSQ
ncbi:MAG: CotH kinase family protein [Anaerolineae bacterium]|nr:CotH kinase family protein [Anaerolineae bacterium]